MPRPHQEWGEGDCCLVGAGGLVVADGDATPLLQAVDAPIHHVALLADVAVERRWPAAAAAAPESGAGLVGPLGDGVRDAPVVFVGVASRASERSTRLRARPGR